MSSFPRRISSFLLPVVTLPVEAEDVTELVKSSQLFRLIPEEKTHFVEASDRLKKFRH